MLTCLAIDIKPGVQRHDVTYFNLNDIWELRQWYSAQICPFITINTHMNSEDLKYTIPFTSLRSVGPQKNEQVNTFI